MAFVVVACTDTGTGVNGDPVADGSVRLLLMTETGELVEYSAPPLTETRRFDLASALAPFVQFVTLAGDSGRGGFYAFEVPQAPVCCGPRNWSLVRYNSSWAEAARKPLTEYIGQDTVYPDNMSLTPDGRFLVGHVPMRSGGIPPQILVLNAMTLDTVRRIDSNSRFPFYGGGPVVAGGAEVVLIDYSTGCNGRAVWLDAETGLVTDSVTLPCNLVLRGFQTRRRLYVTPSTLNAQYTALLIFDVTTGTVAHTQNTVPVSGIIADTARGRLVGFTNEGIVVMNALNLAVQGVMTTDPDTTDLEGKVRFGAIHPATGVFIGDIWGPQPCGGTCYRDPTIVTLMNLDRREVILRQDLGLRITVVR